MNTARYSGHGSAFWVCCYTSPSGIAGTPSGGSWSLYGTVTHKGLVQEPWSACYLREDSRAQLVGQLPRVSLFQVNPGPALFPLRSTEPGYCRLIARECYGSHYSTVASQHSFPEIKNNGLLSCKGILTLAEMNQLEGTMRASVRLWKNQRGASRGCRDYTRNQSGRSCRETHRPFPGNGAGTRSSNGAYVPVVNRSGRFLLVNES